MGETERDEGDDGVLRVRRRWFQGTNTVWFVMYGIMTVVSISILILITDVWQVTVAMIIILCVSAPIFALELNRTFPQEIVVRQSSLDLYVNGRLKRRIEYSPDVLVGIYHERGIHHPRFGPMAGIAMCKDEKCIVCHYDMGWDHDDVRSLWEPLLSKAREFDMRIDPTMQRLLEKMDANAVDTYFDGLSPS